MDYLYSLWRKQYRMSLQQRAKWFTKQPNIKVGDLVVLHEGKIKRGYWKLARVIEILPSRDGSVRKVKISLPRFNDEGKATSHTILKRSVRQPMPFRTGGRRRNGARLRNSLESTPRNDQDVAEN